jgi:predicted nuclease with TOPRIM domain
MGKSRRDKLEDLRARNSHLQEENEHLKYQFHMFKKKFEEFQDSLTIVRIDWYNQISQLAYLGEKVIHMDNWKEDGFT